MTSNSETQTARNRGGRKTENPEPGKTQVVIRGMNGKDRLKPAADLFDALVIADGARTLSNHMVRIDVGDVVQLRWDRNLCTEVNEWELIRTRKMELLGRPRKIRFVSEDPAAYEAVEKAWAAAAKDSNRGYVESLHRYVERYVKEEVPELRQVIVAEYEALGISGLIEILKQPSVLPDDYDRYIKCRDQFVHHYSSAFNFLFREKIDGRPHPSTRFSPELCDEMRAHGFRKMEGEWYDARGVRFVERAWFDHQLMRNPRTGLYEYKWYDPLGIQRIHAKYERLYQRLIRLGAKIEAAYSEGYELGKQAYCDGAAVSGCPYPEGSINRHGWLEAWQSSFEFRADLPHELKSKYWGLEINIITFEMEPFRSSSSVVHA